MAFVTHTVTGDLRQMFGDAIDITQVAGTVETNLTPGMVMVFDLDNDIQRLGSGKLTINTDGTWTLDGVPSWDNLEADQNPTHVQIQVRFEYNDKVTKQRVRWLSGFLQIDHDGSIGEFVAQQLAPADWRSDFMDEAQAKLDAQIDISNIAVSDDVVEALVKNTAGTGPKTSAALAASTAQSILADIPGDVQFVVVRPSGPGAGEFASCRLANAAVAPLASIGRPYVILLYGLDYATSKANLDWHLGDYVHIVGMTPDAELSGALPDNSPDTDITPTSTIYVTKNSTMRDLTVRCRNMRYPIHDDSGNLDKDWKKRYRNVRMLHEGNDGARAWRDANPGSGMSSATVLTSEHAYGFGTSSGGQIEFEDCTLLGLGAWYMHDRQDFTAPSRIALDRCRLISREAIPYVRTQCLGANQKSVLAITNSEVNAVAVRTSDTPWIVSDVTKPQPADHAQVKTVIGGTAAMGRYASDCRGRALKIESSSTSTTSTVRVSGTAAAALFDVTGYGPSTIRDGGGGLKGYVYGWPDISGIGGVAPDLGLSTPVVLKNTIGKLLGDCSSVSKTLTVTVDGGAPVNIVFNTDLTAVSNSTILGTINTALGSAATATEYDVVLGEWFPEYPDRTVTKKNANAAYIPRFSAVKRSGNDIDIMGLTDPASSFYGVTLSAIKPGERGRVMTPPGNLWSFTDLAGLAGTTVSIGQTIYHSDVTPGQFATSGTRAAGICYVSGFMRFNGGDPNPVQSSTIVGPPTHRITAVGLADGAVAALASKGGKVNPSVTFTASTDTVTFAAAHGRAVNDIVAFASVTATGITSLTQYFVKSVPTSTTMTLSTTSGGTTLNITADGTGTYVILNQPNGAKQPSKAADADGYPALTFNASETDTISASVINLGTKLSAYLVFTPVTVGGALTVALNFGAGFLGITSAAKLQATITGLNLVSTAALVAGTKYVAAMVVDGQSLALYIGDEILTGTTASAMTGFTSFALGTSGSSYYDGRIYQLDTYLGQVHNQAQVLAHMDLLRQQLAAA